MGSVILEDMELNRVQPGVGCGLVENVTVLFVCLFVCPVKNVEFDSGCKSTAYVEPMVSASTSSISGLAKLWSITYTALDSRRAHGTLYVLGNGQVKMLYRLGTRLPSLG